MLIGRARSEQVHLTIRWHLVSESLDQSHWQNASKFQRPCCEIRRILKARSWTTWLTSLAFLKKKLSLLEPQPINHLEFSPHQLTVFQLVKTFQPATQQPPSEQI